MRSISCTNQFAAVTPSPQPAPLLCHPRPRLSHLPQQHSSIQAFCRGKQQAAAALRQQHHNAAYIQTLLQPWGHTASGVPRCQRSTTHPGARRVGMHVFDKIRDMLSGTSSEWAGKLGTPKNAAEEEEEEGGELVRIDGDSRGGLGGTTEEVFGPLAVLLVGFMPQEVDAFKSMMNDMDADIVKLIPCTKDMLGGSLMSAMETEFPAYEQPPLGQRRALFFSGMYGSEVTEVIAAYRDAGLPPCVFAGLVPNNANRTVGELLEAVWRDHAAMMAKRQKRQQDSVADSY